jgi:hypothetical protein
LSDRIECLLLQLQLLLRCPADGLRCDWRYHPVGIGYRLPGACEWRP